MGMMTDICGVVIGVMSLAAVMTARAMDRRLKLFFELFFVVLILYVGSDTICFFSEGRPGPAWAAILQMTMFIQSTASSCLLLMLTLLILDSAGDKNPLRAPEFLAAYGLWLVYMGMLILTQFIGVFYTFLPQNVYQRGPLYPVLLLPPMLIMLVDLITVWRRHDKLSNKQQTAFASFIILPTLAMLLQVFYYGLQLISFGTSLATFIMFLSIMTDQAERYYQKERENEHLRVDIMLSQIQPHFLYNTLGAIQSLCRTDPREAERSITKFSRYLRGNMDSIDPRSTIPFSRELEHTRLYLELEQLRYEDALSTAFDIETVDFDIPPLTLQPLVENAVRHGVRGNPQGRGTVTVSSRELPDRFEVTVLDDGPGYDPAHEKEDGRTHIGIKNVQERLKRVSGGSLRVEAAEGRGTRVTIFLPKKEA